MKPFIKMHGVVRAYDVCKDRFSYSIPYIDASGKTRRVEIGYAPAR